MTYIFAGDSWAVKAYTNENYMSDPIDLMEGNNRLADHWGLPYDIALAQGKGNLDILEKILELKIDKTTPVIWVYTEPGRDYGRITGRDEFEWLTSENIFKIRQELHVKILKTIKEKLSNPIALIGGLSDVDTTVARELGFTVLHPSWQQWIAEKLSSTNFEHGWGASDVGWRADYNDVKPSKTAIFAWDEQIKEWCWWEENGYFCHEHPTPKANKEYAEYLKPKVTEWLSSL